MQKCLYLRAKNIVSTLNLDLKNVGVDLDEMIVYENVLKRRQKAYLSCYFYIHLSFKCRKFLKFYSLKEEDKVVVIGQSTAKKLLNFKNLYICENQSLLDCVKLAKTLV